MGTELKIKWDLLLTPYQTHNTSSTHIITTTPTPITLTGPSVTTS